MNAAEKHPQRQEIIDAILAGETLRTIAARVVPPLHHTTLSRFKFQLLQPAIQTLRGTSSKYSEMNAIATATGLKPSNTDPATAIDLEMKRRVADSLDKRLQRRGTWIEHAWNSGTEPDHRALSSHDRNEYNDIELQARLAGLLQSGTDGAGGVSISIQIMPAQAQEQPTCVIVEPSVTRR